MKTELAVVPLKSGESLYVSCVLGPDPAEAEHIPPVLFHKGGVWNWHIEKALTETLDDLENRFYIGEVDGEIVGNICTFEQGGVGIFGHVFTREDQRRKGIATAIMQVLMEDFHQRGGKSLFLGTGYDSPAYHIYHSFGFRGIRPGSGTMRYDVPSQEEGVLLPGEIEPTIREANWGDWARLNLLMMRPGEPFLRNLAYGWFGPSNVEGSYLSLQEARAEDDRYRAWTMETPTRIPIGFATLTPARPWPQPLWHLDFFVHPDFTRHSSSFLKSFDLPEGKIQAYTEATEHGLAQALTDAGWQQEGLLKGHLIADDGKRDVIVWGRL